MVKLLFLIAGMALAGCGSEPAPVPTPTPQPTNTSTPEPDQEEEPDQQQAPKTITYTVTCDTVTCENHDTDTELNTPPFENYQCTWYCMEYEGEPNKYVSLGWQRNTEDDGCFEMTTEYISDGLCN